MADSYTNLLYHIIFSTKYRRPLITPEYEIRLYDYIGGTVRGEGGICLGLNGVPGHLHLLLKLRPDHTLSAMVRKLKANASGWMHDVFPALKHFKWQRGYAAFTGVSPTLKKLVGTFHGRRSIIRPPSLGTSLSNSSRLTRLSLTSDTFERRRPLRGLLRRL
ncbi:MAG TPA: IS200/IS605 family transposase [Pyrinomonadaceae bacterium]|jgi:REP element-mobilizing transposase RayT